MPIDVEQFCRLRPFLFHLTAASNIDRIRQTRELLPAEVFLRAAGREDLLSERRREHVLLDTPRGQVHIRDQGPLHKGSIAFDAGWDLCRLVRDLNSYVFFWPGSVDGPIDAGRRHFARYRHESPVVLRLPSRPLLLSGPQAPLFAWVNSGAPRVSGGRHSPRGGATFTDALAFPRTGGSVVEVVFKGSVRVPPKTDVSSSVGGPWTRAL
jgi:hypothetical protein